MHVVGHDRKESVAFGLLIVLLLWLMLELVHRNILGIALTHNNRRTRTHCLPVWRCREEKRVALLPTATIQRVWRVSLQLLLDNAVFRHSDCCRLNWKRDDRKRLLAIQIRAGALVFRRRHRASVAADFTIFSQQTAAEQIFTRRVRSVSFTDTEGLRKVLAWAAVVAALFTYSGSDTSNTNRLCHG